MENNPFPPLGCEEILKCLSSDKLVVFKTVYSLKKKVSPCERVLLVTTHTYYINNITNLSIVSLLSIVNDVNFSFSQRYILWKYILHWG